MPARPNVVILAAGQGKRMHSQRPKVLHPLAGRPLIAHVIATARALKPKRICVVYGHGGKQVPKAVAASDLVLVKQEPQLGTGHALKQALPHLNGAGCTLVLYGDVPLLGVDTLSAMVADSREELTLLTVELERPDGYGRIVRNRRGEASAFQRTTGSTPQCRRPALRRRKWPQPENGDASRAPPAGRASCPGRIGEAAAPRLTDAAGQACPHAWR